MEIVEVMEVVFYVVDNMGRVLEGLGCLLGVVDGMRL